MDVGHIIRRGGWGHEGIVLDMDSGESTLFKLTLNLSRDLDLRLLGSKRTCGPETVTTWGCKPVFGNQDTKPISVA